MIEVFKFWVRYRYEENKEWKYPQLGMTKEPQGNIQGILKRLSLGMPRKASLLSSSKLSVYLTRSYIFIEKKDAKHYSKKQQENPNKIKWCSKKNTYHVTNENIAPSKVTDNVGDERGDACRGIPKLSCCDLPWILTCVPWSSPSLWSCHSLFPSYRYLTQNLKTSITQNLKELCEIGIG